jgi:pimeloyl-ACP methyl ester carboxylesterase
MSDAPGITAHADTGDGTTVVFVHGSNTDHRIWTVHAEIVGERFRVVAPTQRYFGTGPWPDDGRRFSVETHADDLAEFCERLELTPAALVGWSYGAAVCLAMAMRHPPVAASLVLYEPALATHVFEPEEHRDAADDRSAMSGAARDAASCGHDDAALRAFMDGVNDQLGAFDGLHEDVRRVMTDNARMLRLLFAAPAPSVTCADLARIDVPVTVLVGDDSRAFYAIAARWAARCVPEAELITVPGARHLWPVQEPEAFARAVLGVLNKA